MLAVCLVCRSTAARSALLYRAGAGAPVRAERAGGSGCAERPAATWCLWSDPAPAGRGRLHVTARLRAPGAYSAGLTSSCLDLVGTYSKRQDLADQLRLVLDRLGRAHQEPAEDLKESVRTTAKAAEPHRVVDRLGEQAVRQLIEERQAGVELCELAARYGISLSSVKRIVRLFLAS